MFHKKGRHNHRKGGSRSKHACPDACQREGAFIDLDATLRLNHFEKLDLHGKRRDEVSDSVAAAVSRAIMKGNDTLVVVHGFNSGTVLGNEVKRVLSELLRSSTISAYSLNPHNPGQTIVRI